MNKLAVGSTAPNFNLPDQNGQFHQLSDYRGKWLLLYFYPRDNTPGCTAEACLLRDNWSDFAKFNVVVLGMSADSVTSHGKFAQKFSLPFPLLSDENKAALLAYGVWAEKKFCGKTLMGINRVSFLIDPIGKIAKIYEKVKPLTHASEVLKDLQEFTLAN